MILLLVIGILLGPVVQGQIPGQGGTPNMNAAQLAMMTGMTGMAGMTGMSGMTGGGNPMSALLPTASNRNPAQTGMNALNAAMSRMGPMVMPAGTPVKFTGTILEQKALMSHHKMRVSIPKYYKIFPTNMNMLEWSPRLADKAAAIVKTCSSVNFAGGATNTGWAQRPISLFQGAFTDLKATDMVLNGWFQQYQDWTPGDLHCDDSCQYTQALQADARLVGCAAQKCPLFLRGAKRRNNVFFMACAYDKQQVPRATPFLSGLRLQQCSLCPIDKKQCVVGMCASAAQKARDAQLIPALMLESGNMMGAMASMFSGGGGGGAAAAGMVANPFGGTGANPGSATGSFAGVSPNLGAAAGGVMPTGGGGGSMSSMMNSMMANMFGGPSGASMMGNMLGSSFPGGAGTFPSQASGPAAPVVPVAPAAPVPAPAPSQPCKDTLSSEHCTLLKSMCSTKKIIELCQSTCGQCPKPQAAAVAATCKDKALEIRPTQTGYCAEVSRSNLCTDPTYAPFCKKTCNACSTAGAGPTIP